MSDHVELQLAALTAKVQAGFESVNDRLDREQSVDRERHEENVDRLIRIEDQARETNGRVTRHDEQIKTLFRRHTRVPAGGDESEKRSITRRDVAMLGMGGGFLIAAWKFLEWGVHQLQRGVGQ